MVGQKLAFHKIFNLIGRFLADLKPLQSYIACEMEYLQALFQRKSGSLAWMQGLAWFIFFLIFCYLSLASWPWEFILLWAFINTLFYFTLVYINLGYLLPQFFLKQSFGIYTFLIIGIAFVATPLKVYVNRILALSFDHNLLGWTVDSKLTFISLIIVPALSSLARIPLDWFKMLSEKKELETKNIETELQSLKNQINPHFLFNTLNNLYALTLKKSDMAPEVILKLSDMMRYMLYECNEDKVSLERDLKYITNYIDLEKIRLNKNADIAIQITGDISKTRIAPLMILAFVENSFKHGIKNSIGNAFIHIMIEMHEEVLELIIENSKESVVAGSMQNHRLGGIGLSNVKRRLQILYPSRHSLLIDDQPDLFRVHLTLNTKETI